MFIKYNRPNVHMLPGGIDFKSIHRLMPGWNEFPSEVWKKLTEHPQIKRFVDEGIIEFLEEKKVEKKGKKQVVKMIGTDDSPIDLKDLTEAKAIKIVKETHRRELLQRWRDAETRTKVKRALTKQLKPLLNTKSEDDEDSE